MIVELSSPNLHFKKKYGIIYVRGEKMDKLKETLFETTYCYDIILEKMDKLKIDVNSECYISFRDSYFALLTVIQKANQMTEYKNWIYQYEE